MISLEQPLRKRHTAQQNFDVFAGRRHVLSDLVLADEADSTSPARRRVVKHVIHSEAVRMLGGQLVKLLLEQDIFFVYVGVNEAELRLVGMVTERRTRNLYHGSNASSASNHTNVTRQASAVVKLALRTFDADMVANLEQGDVARDVTLLVCL